MGRMGEIVVINRLSAATRAAPAKRAPAARKRKGHQEEEEDEVEWD